MVQCTACDKVKIITAATMTHNNIIVLKKALNSRVLKSN